MTIEELNRVRFLKKQIEVKTEAVSALRTVSQKATTTYKRDKIGKESFTALDLSGRSNYFESKVDKIVSAIVDESATLVQLRNEYENAAASLTAKIQSEFTDPTEQTILLCRYVACMRFRDIAFSLKYSERRIYQIHDAIIKKL